MIPQTRSLMVQRTTQGSTNGGSSTTSQRRRRPADYPEALPSLLPECYKGPANGIAVIGPGEGPNDSWEATLELVNPHVPDDTTAPPAPLLSPTGPHNAGSIPRSPPPTLRSAGRLSAPRTDSAAVSNTTTTSTTAPAPTVTTPVANRRARSPGEALRQGGCIVFTDSYIHANPHTPVAAMVQNFNLLRSTTSPPPSVSSSPAAQAVDPFPASLPSLPNNTETNTSSQPKVENTTTELIAQYLTEVKEQQRPVFVRRDSPTVYGRGYYYTSPSSNPNNSTKSFPRSLTSPNTKDSRAAAARCRRSPPPPIRDVMTGSSSVHPPSSMSLSVSAKRNTHKPTH